MRWVEVNLYVHSEVVEAMSDYLQDLHAKGIAIEENEKDHTVIVKAYYPEGIDTDSLQLNIQLQIARLREFGLNPGDGEITISLIEESSWENEWKRYFKPIQVTNRLTIKPLWEEYTPQSSDEKIVELEPGMAFGTGTHPTTNLCLQLLEKYIKSQDLVIDVGCGSGILSIAAAKLGAQNVIALDSDPLAVRVAQKNSEINRVEKTLFIQEGDLLKGVTTTAPIIVANLLAEIICLMTYDLPRVLRPGGIFIGSGIVREKEEEVKQSLLEMGLMVLETVYQDHWVAVVAKKW